MKEPLTDTRWYLPMVIAAYMKNQHPKSQNENNTVATRNIKLTNSKTKNSFDFPQIHSWHVNKAFPLCPFRPYVSKYCTMLSVSTIKHSLTSTTFWIWKKKIVFRNNFGVLQCENRSWSPSKEPVSKFSNYFDFNA